MLKHGPVFFLIICVVAMFTSCMRFRQYQANIKRRKKITVLVADQPSLWAEEVKNSFAYAIKKKFGRRIRVVMLRVSNSYPDGLLQKKILATTPDCLVVIGDLPVREICATVTEVPLLLLKKDAEDVSAWGAGNVHVVSGGLPASRLAYIQKTLLVGGFGQDGVEVRLSGKALGRAGAVVMSRLFDGKSVATVTAPAEMCILLNTKMVKSGMINRKKLEALAAELSCSIQEI